jgi:hypothetical protein
MWPTVLQAFRRATPPLAWYYAITLALPLANGAAQAGVAFVEHAMVVLVLPPVLIVLACAAYEGARVLPCGTTGCGMTVTEEPHKRSHRLPL